jgi:diacylglycerol kinase family enzyme
VFTPPNTDDNGGTDVQSSRTALNAALRMSEQLDVIISQLQRQEGVISMQHRLLQQKDAHLTAVIAAQSSSSSLLSSEQRGSIKLQVNIEKANSSATSSFLAESGRQASMEHKVTHVDI